MIEGVDTILLFTIVELPILSARHCIAKCLSRTEQLQSYSGLLSRATPVCIPTLLRSTLLHYSSPLLDWTGLHSTCFSTGLAPDLTWEVAVIHLSLMHLFLVIYTY